MESGQVQGDKKAGATSAPPPGDDPLIGSVIGERYRVLELLGRGGMAAVYRGEHELLKRMVAIKVVLPQLNTDADMLKRFEREALAAGKLDHPNCVHVTDFGRTASGRFFLVMEYLDGHALAEVLIAHERLPVERAVSISRGILRGLARAHELGIVHRDLKSANIMLVERESGKEVAKIIDFGIAKMMSDAEATRGFKTEAGIVFGTADYLAPERLVSAPHIDGRCDLYSVGIIMYEMLTGERPFHSDDAMEIVQRQLKEQPRSPRMVAPDAGISPELEGIVLRALAKDPRDRWPNAKAMLEALDGVKLTAEVHETRAEAHTPALPSSVPTSVVKLVSARDKQAEVAPDGVAAGLAMAPIVPVQTPTEAFRQRKRRITRAGMAWLIGAPLAVIGIVIIALATGGSSAKEKTADGETLPTSGPAAVSTGVEIDRLAHTAAQGETVGERQDAYDQLVKLGYRDRVDFTAKLGRDLAEEKTCEKRRDVAAQLGRLGDARALAALQEAVKKPENSCLVATANESIVALGGTPETTAKTAPKSATTKKKTSGGGSKKITSNADRF